MSVCLCVCVCVNRKSRVIPRLGHAGDLKAYSRVIGTMGTCDMTLVVDND